MTRGDEMIATTIMSLEDLRKLAYGPYARHDISRIIDPLGSRLETFLRMAALPMASRKDKLFQLINALSTQGLDQTSVDQLHALRDLYNESKHDPATPLLLARAVDVVDKAAVALGALCALGIGIVGAPFGRELNYSLWVGFWDHFTGGMTDIAVMLPGDHWTHVSTVDVFQMDIAQWDGLKPILQAHPRFRLGKQHFQPHVWESMREEGDFLDAGVWDGEYSELIRLLAPFHNADIEKRLLPGLARVDNAVSVGTALIMAAVDVARAASTALHKTALQSAIIARSMDEYAIASDEPHVRTCAAQLADGLLSLPFATWGAVAGPVLVKRDADLGCTIEGPLPLGVDDHAFILRAI
jgi:hypothetical protein